MRNRAKALCAGGEFLLYNLDMKISHVAQLAFTLVAFLVSLFQSVRDYTNAVSELSAVLNARVIATRYKAACERRHRNGAR